MEKSYFERLNILNSLVGKLDENTMSVMEKRLDMFLNKKVSVFIPLKGQCPYATQEKHTHPGYSFIIYHQPEAELIIEGKRIIMPISNENCLIAISPDIEHQEPKTSKFLSYVAIVVDRDEFVKVMNENGYKIETYYGKGCKPDPELYDIIRCFMLEIERKDLKTADNLANIIIKLLARSITDDTGNNIELSDRLDINEAIGYMNTRIADKITVNEIAASAGMSTSGFTKKFKEQINMSPMEYLADMRISKARTLLIENKLSITEIALECGFSSTSYFSTSFTERYGMSPAKYLKNIN